MSDNTIAFNERIRQYWLEVGEHQCQYEWYDEDDGWVQCEDKAKHVHHIKGEAETIFEGKDPDHNVGLPLCEAHHVRNINEDVEWEHNFSFHPDMGKAYRNYAEWKQEEKHLNSITGKISYDYSTSPFADASRVHKEKAKNGERYIAGSDDIDFYYEQKMVDKAVRYNAEHGIVKPKIRNGKNK